jgi:glutathione S-transferase
MAPSPTHFDLIYWPTLPGRGEFIRLILEDAGADYTDHAIVSGADRVLELIDSAHLGTAASGPPVLRPPILKHGDAVLTQTPNIAMYAAAHVGLAPAPGLDSPGFFHVQGLVQTALDGLCNETHDTHHPIACMDYYEDQREAAALRGKDYRTTRLPKFLAYYERVVKGPASGDGPWLYGGRCTVADIVLFHVGGG